MSLTVTKAPPKASAPPRSGLPDPADRVFVVALIDELGAVAAAAHLDLSRLAMLNVANGLRCYRSTLRRVREVRASGSGLRAPAA